MLEKLTFDVVHAGGKHEGRKKHEVQGYLVSDHFAVWKVTKPEAVWQKPEYTQQYHHRNSLFSLVHLASGCRVCFCANPARAVKIAKLLEESGVDWDWMDEREVSKNNRDELNSTVRRILFTHLIPNLGEGFPPFDARMTAQERAEYPQDCTYPFIVWHDERRKNRVIP